MSKDKDVIYALFTEGGNLKSTFARYNLNRIRVNRTRKRAIERARRKTENSLKMKTIEVGDTVKVGFCSYGIGYEVGTIGVVSEVEDFISWTDVVVTIFFSDTNRFSKRYYKIEDVELIEKAKR